MAAQIKVHINYILVNFDYPDGSTSWAHINYDSLVLFDSPDGSTSWDNIIIIFWLIFTFQMAAQVGVI